VPHIEMQIQLAVRIS